MAIESRNEEFTERFCPRYQRAVEIVGRRWSGAILRAMLAGASRFGEIQEAIPALSNRMLSERLREFEAEGIVERVVTPERPVRVEYRLTEKGRALNAVVEALSRWSQDWVDLETGEADEERSAAAG